MACFTSAKAKTSMCVLAALVLFGVPAGADEPTPAMLDLAAKILADNNLRQSVDVIVPAMFAELERNLVTMHPEMRQPLHDAIVEMMPGYAGGETAVLKDVSQTLASQMTESELKATLDFFESEPGKKYVASQPAMIKQLGISAGAWRQQLSNDIVPRLREAMKKKGYDF